jgi:hypothetical protein
MADFPDLVRVTGIGGTSIISLAAKSGVISAGGRYGPHPAAVGEPAGEVGEDGGLQLTNRNGMMLADLHGGSGKLVLRAPSKPQPSPGKPGPGKPGEINLDLSAMIGTPTIHLDGGQGDIWLGGNGVNGDLMVFAESGDNKTAANATIRLNGKEGDIQFQNADCAEEFDLAEGEEAMPGSIMVIGEDGKLRLSREPYDRRVIGVVSGAGTLKPAIILGRKHSTVPRAALAVVGCVFCNVDATKDRVRVGDLLTTASRPGFAMRARSSSRALGAVLGKALRAQSSGLGLLPVLVALQ